MIETKTVGVVLFKDEEVLLVRHLAGGSHINDTYGLPAGRNEPDESDSSAALRELKEETGLSASVADLVELPIKYHAVLKRKNGEEAMVMTAFLCSKWKGDLGNSTETAPEWIEISQLKQLPLIPNVLNAIRQALKFKPL